MSHPLVVHCKRQVYDVYIGRPSTWGNPFTVEQHGRGNALALYREWVKQQPALIARAKSELAGKVLGCWCAPNACHGDILATIANEPRYILIFGSRWWRNKELIRAILVLQPKNTVVIHGDNGYNRRGKALWGMPDDRAVRGADKLAGAIARRMGLRVIQCTPKWREHGLEAGPIRNSYMLKTYPIAQAYGFHNNIASSSGSGDMWRKCLNKKIPVEIIKEPK